MATRSVEGEAQAILALSVVEQRIRLVTVLNRARREELHSTGLEMALDFNAHLCTRIREIAEARKCPNPWSG
jgi:hypothetical protein